MNETQQQQPRRGVATVKAPRQENFERTQKVQQKVQKVPRMEYNVSLEDLAVYEGLHVFTETHLPYLRWSDEDETFRVLNYFSLSSSSNFEEARSETTLNENNNNTIAPLSLEDLALLKTVRGWIFRKSTKSLCYKSMPYPTETDTTSDSAPLPGWVFETGKAFMSVEGTLLRLFYENREMETLEEGKSGVSGVSGVWYLSTNKKLDAFQSRWSSRFSFGNMFVHALDGIFPSTKTVDENILKTFTETLDKSKVYAFLIRSNQENRVVCRSPTNTVPKNKVVYLGAWTNSVFTFSDDEDKDKVHQVYNNTSDEKDGEGKETMLSALGRPVHCSYTLAGSTEEDFSTWVEKNTNIWEYQGVLLVHPITLETVMIVPKEYKYYADLR